MITGRFAKPIMHGLRPVNGFTLIELLVVIATIAVLSAILLPALGQSGAGSKSFQCMENTRRLTTAWQLYAEDNHDRFVVSSDDGNGTAPYQTTVAGGMNQGNLSAWTWSKMDFSPNNPYNWDPTADITLRPLWQYVKDSAIYKCPGDASQITIGSLPAGYTGPYTVGSLVPRIRSYSMNFFLGGFGGMYDASYDVSEPWASHYPIYKKLSDVNSLSGSPGPSKTFVFLDERQDCINWGNYLTDMYGYPYAGAPANPYNYRWYQDIPASYHGLACCISFADGHAEIHRWQVPSTYPPLAPGSLSGGKGSGTMWPVPYSQDVAWMQNVAARPH
jgi:prepilin-type N-terminal cleavage/methylation domain-containing protein